MGLEPRMTAPATLIAWLQESAKLPATVAELTEQSRALNFRVGTGRQGKPRWTAWQIDQALRARPDRFRCSIRATDRLELWRRNEYGRRGPGRIR